MTIQQLRYLLEINRAGSISQAAKNMYVSQSSVSNALNLLEEEIGFRIFERTWEGVSPTQRGASVLEHASKICEHHRLIMGTSGMRSGRVVIQTSNYVSFGDAFCRLAQESRLRGDVSLCHSFSDSESGLRRLAQFESDLVVICRLCVPGNIQNFDYFMKKYKLEWKKHKTLPAVARIGPGHSLYNQENLTSRDLNNDTIVDTPDQAVITSGPFRYYVDVDPERALLAAERRTRYEMVCKGMGYCIGAQLPTRINQEYGFRNIPLGDLCYEIISVTNPLRPVCPEVLRYLELLEEELSEF